MDVYNDSRAHGNRSTHQCTYLADPVTALPGDGFPDGFPELSDSPAVVLITEAGFGWRLLLPGSACIRDTATEPELNRPAVCWGSKLGGATIPCKNKACSEGFP